MSRVVYNRKHKEVLDSLLLHIPGVISGTMFGYPAYYVDKKLFACIYGEGVGIKIPVDIADALVGKEGIVRFQPMGRRPMREWIQISRERSEDYQDDLEILKTSLQYVSSRSK